MSANNSFCGVGIAFEAKVGGEIKAKTLMNFLFKNKNYFYSNKKGIRLLNDAVTDIMEAQAMAFKLNYIDIFTASWGPPDNGELIGEI